MIESIIKSFDVWIDSQSIKSRTRVKSIDNISLEGIARLRELILELAVRGKLVMQDPTDGHAIELINQIAIEKKKLGLVARIITQDSKPFEIPENWTWTNLSNLGVSSTGKTPSTSISRYFGGEIPFLGPGQITTDGKIINSEKSLTEEGTEHSTIAHNGDILMVCIGGSIGKSAIVKSKVSFNQQLNCIHPILTNSYFLNSVFNSPYFQGNILKNATGSATPIINRGKWEKILIPIPPIPEQKRIVAKIDELMSLCDELENQQIKSLSTHQTLVSALLETLTQTTDTDVLQLAWKNISLHFDTLFCTEDSIEQLKRTILQLAIMGRLVNQDPNDEPASELVKKIALEKQELMRDGIIKKQTASPKSEQVEEPFKLPSNWQFEKLDNICYLITDGTHQTPRYTDAGRIFISSQNIKPFQFLPEKHRFVSEDDYQLYIKNRKPEFDDLLLTRVGSNIGEAAVIDLNIEFAIYVSVGLIKPVKKYINSNYLAIWLNSPLGRFYSERNTYGKGVSQGNLNLNLIRNFAVSVPPLPEQDRIVMKVGELFSLCEKLKNNINNAQILKTTMSKTIIENAIL